VYARFRRFADAGRDEQGDSCRRDWVVIVVAALVLAAVAAAYALGLLRAVQAGSLSIRLDERPRRAETINQSRLFEAVRALERRAGEFERARRALRESGPAAAEHAE
jgi:hypothetical protein